MERRIDDPKLTQKQTAKEMGFPDSTSKRYRRDASIDRPNIRKNFLQLSVTPSHVKAGKSDNLSGKEIFDQAFDNN